MKLEDLDTPSVIVDQDVVDQNIKKCQAYFDKHQIVLRPHIKTHKLPLIAQQQIAAGAKGITCQKVSEAEVMADGGCDDILITYNIVGAKKLDRLVTLSKRLKRLSVVADSQAVVDGLATAFAADGGEINVLIECDTGGKRCGVQSPSDAVELAEHISQSDGVIFAGLMTYPAIGTEAAVQQYLAAALEGLRKAGLDCPVVSSGGSPGMWHASDVSAITEYRVGTYVYGDRSMVHRGIYEWSDCALSALTTVVSTPTKDRAIVDAGSKVLAADLLGMKGHGRVAGRSDLLISGLAEEHGILVAEDGETGLEVGDRVRIIPNHCCVVSNLADAVVFYRGDQVISTTPVAARGKVV